MNDLENTIKRLQEGDLAGAENDALEYLTGKTADGSDSAKRDISNEERGRLTAALERALSGQPTSKSAEEVVEGLNAGGLKALDTALRLTDVERVVSREEVGKARTKAILNFSDNDDPAPRKRELLNEMNAAGNALLDEREDARRRAHVIRYMQAEAQMARVDSDVHEAYHQLSNMLGYPTGNPQLDSQTFVPVIGVGATLSDIRESRSDLNMTMEEKAGYVNLARKTLLYMVKRSTDGSGDNNTLKYVCEALALFDGKEIEKALEWVAGNPLRGDEVVEAATNALQTVKERAREKAKPKAAQAPAQRPVAKPPPVPRDAVPPPPVKTPLGNTSIGNDEVMFMRQIYDAAATLMKPDVDRMEERIAVEILQNYVERDPGVQRNVGKLPANVMQRLDVAAIAALVKTAAEGKTEASGRALEALVKSRAPITDRKMKELSATGNQTRAHVADCVQVMRHEMSASRAGEAVMLPPPVPNRRTAQPPGAKRQPPRLRR